MSEFVVWQCGYKRQAETVSLEDPHCVACDTLGPPQTADHEVVIGFHPKEAPESVTYRHMTSLIGVGWYCYTVDKAKAIEISKEFDYEGAVTAPDFEAE